MKIDTFLDIIDQERLMMLTDQLSKNRKFICDKRKNVRTDSLFNFVSSVHLDSSLKMHEEEQLRRELSSVPWNYIAKKGLKPDNSKYIDFKKEDYEVWKIKSYLTGLCEPL